MAREAPLWENKTFPAYEFRPYPGWRDMPDGTRVLCASAEHEAEETAARTPKPAEPEKPRRKPVADDAA